MNSLTGQHPSVVQCIRERGLQANGLGLDMDMQVSHASQSCLAGPLDPDDVVAWFLKLVPCYRVPVGSKFYRIAVRFNADRWTAVAKIPFFLPVGGTKGSHLEGHGRTDTNSRGGPVIGMH